MKAVKLETEDAGKYKYAAYMDARLKSSVAQMNYTARQQAKCLAMRYALESVYKAKEFHLNYRFNFTAALKIDEPQVTNRNLLKQMEDDWENDPCIAVAKKITKQGIVYQVTVL